MLLYMYPRRRNMTTSKARLKKKKKPVTYAKITPKMVNPRNLAGNEEEKADEEELSMLVSIAF